MTDRRIVVGVDGSEASAAALAWAVDEARLRGVGLDVVLTWEPAYAGYLHMPPLDGLEEAAQATVAKIVADLGLSGTSDPPTAAIAVEGASAVVLIEQSKDAELLVVGSRGLGGFRGMLLGSVSQHCVTHAHCPVVVIRLSEAEAEAP